MKYTLLLIALLGCTREPTPAPIVERPLIPAPETHSILVSPDREVVAPQPAPDRTNNRQPAGLGGCHCSLTGTACLCSSAQCKGGDCWNYSVAPITSPQGQWVSRWENRDGAWKWWNYRTSKGAEAGSSCPGGNCNVSGGVRFFGRGGGF